MQTALNFHWPSLDRVKATFLIRCTKADKKWLGAMGTCLVKAVSQLLAAEVKNNATEAH
jgi:hypothetical protein